MPNFDSLLMFSGGIDSTNCFYHFLRNNLDKKLLVCHVILINREGRNERELEAVNNIINWLRNKGLDNFKYIEVKYEQPNHLFVMYDMFLYGGYVVPVLAKTYKFEEMIIPEILCDTQRFGQSLINRRKKIKQVRDILLGKEIKTVHPLENKTKCEIIDELPEDLFQLTWFCRKPIKGKACKKCITCDIVLKCFKNTNVTHWSFK